ncbi:MAG: ImmA/IrrE family metallo-endopeptidase [Bifidobacterium tibiigranuli]|jgi:Zn-dependent peptidase ImmA (M78 family)|nr:ImmA/IrrE family metallo-endopeptidase [Bifidobacterium tibiigranuli]
MIDVEAEALKWASVYTIPTAHGSLGAYDGEEHAIYLSNRLSPTQRRWVLAHEISHARHHDGRCYGSRNHMERRADMEASRMIIDPLEYMAAEKVYDNPLWLARELDVMPQTIFAYREWLHDSMYLRV